MEGVGRGEKCGLQQCSCIGVVSVCRAGNERIAPVGKSVVIEDKVSIYETRFTLMRHALGGHGGTTAMKLVCAGPEQRGVGVHVIGDNADEMLQGFAVAPCGVGHGVAFSQGGCRPKLPCNVGAVIPLHVSGCFADVWFVIAVGCDRALQQLSPGRG